MNEHYFDQVHSTLGALNVAVFYLNVHRDEKLISFDLDGSHNDIDFFTFCRYYAMFKACHF